jgi:hypothetical protein
MTAAEITAIVTKHITNLPGSFPTEVVANYAAVWAKVFASTDITASELCTLMDEYIAMDPIGKVALEVRNLFQ